MADLSFIKKDQMIIPPNDDIIAGWDEVSSHIYDCLIRYMKDMTQDKLKLFISHAKRDGLVVAENLRNSLRSKTKLDSFFDKNDIIEGVDFEKQIKENVKSSLLMVLDSDAYGTRQWCQKEIKADKCNDDDTNQTVYNSMRLDRSVGLVTLLRIVFFDIHIF